MLNTVVVHILCCVQFIVVWNLLRVYYVWFVCSIQFVYSTQFVAVHVYMQF